MMGRGGARELGIMGEHGARHVLRGLVAELDVLINWGPGRQFKGSETLAGTRRSLRHLPKSYLLFPERASSRPATADHDNTLYAGDGKGGR